jgi:hydroxybutyrate-dimer hydrolase
VEVNVNGGSVELALQFRALATGRQLPATNTGTSTVTGVTAVGDAGLLCARVQEGLQAATMSGRLDDRPVAIVHGRADALIQVSHSSRAYYALAGSQGATGLRYYEVQHAQHFDGYLGLPGMGERYVPLNAWLERALTLVDANLQLGEALPASQVVRSSPRGAGLPALTEAHLGRLAADPGADAVLFDGVRLKVPE